MRFIPYRAFLNNRWYLGTEQGEWTQSDLYYKPKDLQKIIDCSMCPQIMYHNYICKYTHCENFSDYWRRNKNCCPQKKD